MTKTIRRTMVAATVAAMALAPISLAFAQAGPGGRWAGNRARFERQAGFARGFGLGLALGRLNLTEQQRDAIRTIRQGHEPEFEALRQRMRAAGDAMRAAMSAEVVDENAVRAASAQMGEVHTEQAVLQARIRNEIWNILTPEQKAQANNLRTQATQRAEQRRQLREQRRQLREQRRQHAPAQKPAQ